VTFRRVLLVLVVLLGACGSGPSSSSSSDGGGSDAGSAGPSTSSSVSQPANDLPPVADEPTSGRVAIPGFGEVEVRIVEGPDGEPIVICVMVADTPDQRARGLMEVTDLGGYDGMLFRFEGDSDGGFWMKDTVMPLSIAYLDADGAVVSTADMDPCPDGTDCPSYAAAGPYRMALEVPQGGLDPLGLTDGSSARIEVTDQPCAPLET
jgi:uncharacterized membrane protein (UPF0127 family)